MAITQPLADRIRPASFDDIVGQKHLLDEGGVLRRIAESGRLCNMIFYGPSGVGKTTVARILAETAGKTLHKLNGTTASTADIKAVLGELGSFSALDGVVLYLDEIQYLNKKQQQTLLEFIEDGSVTLIASTTENPYFYVYNAILSRCTVFEFKPVEAPEMEKAVKRAFAKAAEDGGEPIAWEEGVVEHLAFACGGDVRKALNAVELAVISAEQKEDQRYIGLEQTKLLSQRSNMRYDRDGDEHYDILSALQKSVRGSDENAALHYLSRLLVAGDLLSPCRRLLVMASEDVGLAYPMAAVIVKACVDTATQVGLPEAMIPLAHAVIVMCTAPKSNSGVLAIGAAMGDVQAGKLGEIPAHLKDAHYKGAAKMGRGVTYQYPHDFPGHYVEQQYLPDLLKDRVYYEFGPNKTEQAAKAYREQVKGLHQGKKGE